MYATVQSFYLPSVYIKAINGSIAVNQWGTVGGGRSGAGNGCTILPFLEGSFFPYRFSPPTTFLRSLNPVPRPEEINRRSCWYIRYPWRLDRSRPLSYASQTSLGLSAVHRQAFTLNYRFILWTIIFYHTNRIWSNWSTKLDIVEDHLKINVDV